jgi:hypothetical protein
VSGLDVGVLPRGGGFDEPGLDAESGQPAGDGLGDEPRPVVGADPGGDAVEAEQSGQVVHDGRGGDRAGDQRGIANLEYSSSTESMRSLEPSARRMLMKS